MSSAQTALRATCGRLRRAALLLVAVPCLVTVAASAETSPQAAFLAENEAAMAQMMAGMNVPPSGNVDRDFAAMMIPHHQGAIDMAQAELRYGHDEKLRRLAQEIVVSQTQEIVVMRLAMNNLAVCGDACLGAAPTSQAGALARSHRHQPKDSTP